MTKSNLKFFKNSKSLPVDTFFQNVLYDKKIGYYNTNIPFGDKGDFITAPKISNLFSEIISIWFILTWKKLGKPKNFNIVELGPGDGELVKTLIKVSKKFPDFNAAKKIFLYEISEKLRNVQKKNINDKNIRWIKNFDKIKDGPIIFFGNEFFDAIPIKQYKKSKNTLYEKFYFINKKFEIRENFKKVLKKELAFLNSFKTLKNQKFIEFPKLGFKKLNNIVKKILKQDGCIMLIDYGYLQPNNQNTLQSVMRHKKNNLLKNLGKADVTSHVNFNLLTEFLKKNSLKVEKIISQSEFLKKMGIIERAELMTKKMKFRDKANLYLRLKRLLSPKLMGNLFKVIFAYNFKNDKNLDFK